MGKSKGYIVGTWANIRCEYIKKHEPDFYQYMLRTHSLDRYLMDYQTMYQMQANALHEKLAKERGVDERLQQKNVFDWIIKTEQIQEDVRKAITALINKN